MLTTSNDDWGIMIEKPSYDYGIKINGGGSYAWYVLNNNSGVARMDYGGYLYAPIWYDYDNSSYYVDPSAGTSAVLYGSIKQAGVPFMEQVNTIAANYTISSGYNAMTIGPITINTGVSVTIPTGSNWVILG